MKTTTIEWHNVATDGLPEVSGEYLTVTSCGYVTEMTFSKKHQLFNTRDEIDSPLYPIEVDWWAEKLDL